MMADTIVVPEGHEVIVVKPAREARTGRLPCGVFVVDYGENGDWPSLHRQMLSAYAESQTSTLIILQRAMIEHLRNNGLIAPFFKDWKQYAAEKLPAIWVLPLDASMDADLVAGICAMGYGAHGSAADGACFVEVHKPDGSVVVGMPGPQLQGA